MQTDYEVCDVDYNDEQAILRGQALREAWPETGRCETCNGTGEVTDYEDVCGDGGPRMQVWGPCPDCVEKGLCPACGSDNLDDNDYCTCKACGFRIDPDSDEVVNPKATADAAVAALREQAHREDSKYLDEYHLSMPSVAAAWTFDYDIEVGHGIGYPPDAHCWYWEIFRKRGLYPIDGCGGYATADEALLAALEVR